MKITITPKIRALMRAALSEDIGAGDVTTAALIPSALLGQAEIEARQNGVFCGGGIVVEVFRLLDPRIRVTPLVRDGSRLSKGNKVIRLKGRVQSILKGERVALNFLGWLSGIATLTRRYVQETRGTRAKIYDTRKTTPLWREFEKYAVRVGGGRNHRFRLSDEILVKDNHWHAIWGFRDGRQDTYFEDRMTRFLERKKIPVEVEVKSHLQLKSVLKGALLPDRILLDHFDVKALHRAIQFVRRLPKRKRPELEASGGIRLDRIRETARTGVERISIGALTHSAPALDFSLNVVRTV